MIAEDEESEAEFETIGCCQQQQQTFENVQRYDNRKRLAHAATTRTTGRDLIANSARNNEDDGS